MKANPNQVQTTVKLLPVAQEVKDRLTAEWTATKLISASLVLFDRLDYAAQKAAILAVSCAEPVDADAVQQRFRDEVLAILAEHQARQDDQPAKVTRRQAKRTGQ